MNDIEIMGVLNITKNSFYDGGMFNDHKKSLQHAKYMISEGADTVSYTHLRAPRDATLSRMPSSA